MVSEAVATLFPNGTPFVHNGQAFIRSPENPLEWTYLELQGEIQNNINPSTHKGTLSGATGDHLWAMPLGEFTNDPKVREN